MDGGEDEEELEVESGTVSFGEHAFQFEKFEQVRLPFLTLWLALPQQQVLTMPVAALRRRVRPRNVHGPPRVVQDVPLARADEAHRRPHAPPGRQGKVRGPLLQGASSSSSSSSRSRPAASRALTLPPFRRCSRPSSSSSAASWRTATSPTRARAPSSTCASSSSSSCASSSKPSRTTLSSSSRCVPLSLLRLPSWPSSTSTTSC